MLLLTISLIASSIGVAWLTINNFQEYELRTYKDLAENASRRIEREFKKGEEATQTIIFNSEIQLGFTKTELSATEQNQLIESFSYLNYPNLQEVLYIDSQQNLFTKVYQEAKFSGWQQTELSEKLEKVYGEMIWSFEEDWIFSDGEPSLLIGRNVHSVNQINEPGKIILKVSEATLQSLFSVLTNENNLNFHLLNRKGEQIYGSKSLNQKIDFFDNSLANTSGSHFQVKETESGIGIFNYNPEIQLALFVEIPNQTLYKNIFNNLFILFLIYLVVIICAFFASYYFSKRLTKPIRAINQAMSQFDGQNFSNRLNLSTQTELDTIGESYNYLLDSFQQILNDNNKKQEELRSSEIRLLMYQMNPHFLYNTLDTIYMIARMNQEKTTMEMIQALSKFLKISLSKGEDVISLADELAHVTNYMKIQQIRNPELFDYQLTIDVPANEVYVTKLILQPIVENSIKYGFSEIYEGGKITISAEFLGENLCIIIENNGLPITTKQVDLLNSMNKMDIWQIKDVYADQENGYGIGSILTRIRLLYGDRSSIYFESLITSTRVTVTLPRIEGDDKESD